MKTNTESADTILSTADQISDEVPLAITFSQVVEPLFSSVFIFALFFFPIAFGGVHLPVYLLIECLFFFLFLFVLFSKLDLLRTFRLNRLLTSPSYTVAAVLLVFICYLPLQWIVLSLQQPAHPLLEDNYLTMNVFQLLSHLRESLFFFTVFFLSLLYLRVKESNLKNYTILLLLSGALVSLISLTHWFYDNGRLFWTIEGEYVFISDRARWPFVNPNHLAQFLIPVFFITLITTRAKYKSLFDLYLNKFSSANKGFVKFIANPKVQKEILPLFVFAVTLILISISILASGSRSSWLGLMIALLFFITVGRRHVEKVTIDKNIRKEHQNPDSTYQEPTSKRKSRKRRRRRESSQQHFVVSLLNHKAVRKLSNLFLIFLCIVLLLFLMNERGIELLEDRVAFGLTSSKDDIRWQLYIDSFAILKENLFFGIGLGKWNGYYLMYMDQLLSGINPVFLHSDPYQFFIECGLFGILPFVFLAFYLLRRLFEYLSNSRLDSRSKELTLGISCGLVGLIIASGLDFPFHIPAIYFYIAVYLSLVVHQLESAVPPTK